MALRLRHGCPVGREPLLVDVVLLRVSRGSRNAQGLYSPQRKLPNAAQPRSWGAAKCGQGACLQRARLTTSRCSSPDTSMASRLSQEQGILGNVTSTCEGSRTCSRR